MAAEQETVDQAKKPTASKSDHIIVRPLPKFVLMYPSFVVALIAAIMIQLRMGNVDTLPTDAAQLQIALASARFWTLLFLATFFLNSLILTFDFGRMIAVAVALSIMVVLLLIHQFHLELPLVSLLNSWQPVAYPSFYYGFVVMVAIIFAWIFLDTRFNYWEITPNELLHHHGFLGDVERFPAPNMSIKKEISDVFEFLLLGSGTLIFFPAGRDRPVILENVMRINSVEDRIKSTLDAMRVKIDIPGQN
jgi:hypothetical protein